MATEIPDGAVQAAAAVIRQWGPMVDMTGDDYDFAPEAREVLAAALPHLERPATGDRKPRMVINNGPPPEPEVRYVPVAVCRGPGGRWMGA